MLGGARAGPGDVAARHYQGVLRRANARARSSIRRPTRAPRFHRRDGGSRSQPFPCPRRVPAMWRRAASRRVTTMKTLARGQDQAEVLQRLRRLSPDSERLWGRMSVHQMVCHLSDACRMAMGQTEAATRTGLVRRTFTKWVALYAPVKRPPGIRPFRKWIRSRPARHPPTLLLTSPSSKA